MHLVQQTVRSTSTRMVGKYQGSSKYPSRRNLIYINSKYIEVYFNKDIVRLELTTLIITTD